LILKTDYIYPIGFYGHVEEYVDHHGVKRKKMDTGLPRLSTSI